MKRCVVKRRELCQIFLRTLDISLAHSIFTLYNKSDVSFYLYSRKTIVSTLNSLFIDIGIGCVDALRKWSLRNYVAFFISYALSIV